MSKLTMRANRYGRTDLNYIKASLQKHSYDNVILNKQILIKKAQSF